MVSWFARNLNLNELLSTRLLWDQAGWSIASAFGIFITIRTGLSIFAVLSAGISLWAWAQSRKNYRAIVDIPTVKLASAAQGQVELTGTGDSLPEYPIVSPLTALPCLWFDFKIEQGRGRDKRILQQGRSELPFALKDENMRVMILPEGATVISKHRQTWQRGEETCSESVLLKDDTLYVLGEFMHIGVDSNHQSLDNQAKALLHEWKNNQDSLKSRFDDDGNGVIDMQEWETARRAAQQEALTGKTISNNPIMQRIRKPQFGGIFIISNYSAQQLAERFQRWSWLHIGIFFAAVLAASWQ